jgi:hypothetical protein
VAVIDEVDELGRCGPRVERYDRDAGAHRTGDGDAGVERRRRPTGDPSQAADALRDATDHAGEIVAAERPVAHAYGRAVDRGQ